MKKTLITLGIALVAVCLFVFVGCKKNPDGAKYNPNQLPAEQTVTVSIQGRVLDENGVPLQGAAVSSGTANATTDANGVFSFSNIATSNRFGYVKVSKPGYFTGSRSIITNAGQSNYISIQLIPRKETGSFSGTSGGNVTIGTGNSVVFKASSIVNDATKAAYTGTVHVFAAYLDPTDKSLPKNMPGDLRGIDSSGNETLMISFGMLVVEMQDDNGNKLQLASGQQATLTFAIPSSQQAVAPATIPLWYFNDSTGRWIQQGTAARQGNNYIGQVGHFSFWNCDAPSGAINFQVYLKDQSGNPLVYTYIQFKTAANDARGGYTDSAGFAHGLVPKGQALVLEVSTECGQLLGSLNIPPSLNDVDLGTVTIQVHKNMFTVSGTVVNCTGLAVDSGYVMLTIDGLTYGVKVSKGAFSLPIVRCFDAAAQVTAIAADALANQTGSLVTKTADPAQATSLDMGQLSACGAPVQYITCVWKGNTLVWSEPLSTFKFTLYDDPTYSYTLVQSYTNTNQSMQLYIRPQVSAPGAYSMTFYGYSQVASIKSFNGVVPVTISAAGPVNGFITGTFSGTSYDTLSNSNLPISGAFQVTRAK